MTLVECFTDSHVDNIAASLRLRPDRMILVGDGREMEAPVGRYRKLLKQRGLSTEVSVCPVQKKDAQEICAVLSGLLKKDDSFVIDLTGGDETVIMAVGGALAMLDGKKRQQVRVEKYDYGMLTVVDCMADNRPVPYKPMDLTVTELLELHGGCLHPDSYQPPMNCASRDIAGLWQVVSEEPKAWNQQIMLLNQFESDNISESEKRITVPLEDQRSSKGFEEKEKSVRQLLERLHRNGVIENRSSKDKLDYTYDTTLLRYCTRKAGNVLEIKTLLEGREVIEGGASFFGDCRMSVSIDWDGVPHHAGEKISDTRNEIDVVLMHGQVPLFISCKNGNIDEEELYKLHTVTERFGGPHAKKMLIATELDRKSDSADKAFIQRARDMGVYLVTDAGTMSDEQWEQVFKKAIR